MMVWLTGLFMAMADSVPGVSGGTIAYILGQYEKLFKHLGNIIKRNLERESVMFLLRLAIGWIIGFTAAVLVLDKILETHIYGISSMFLGLIVFSIVILLKEEKNILLKNKSGILFALIGFAVVTVLVYFQGANSTVSTDVSTYTAFTYIYVFAAGAVAICAMLLPGISGSALLMIFGIYVTVIDAVAATLRLDFTYVPLLLCLALGIVLGGIFAVKVINNLFKKHRIQMIYLVLGLLVGSILSIIQGPKQIDATFDALSLSTFSITAFIAGILVLLGLNLLSKKISR